jgi:zinc protease
MLNKYENRKLYHEEQDMNIPLNASSMLAALSISASAQLTAASLPKQIDRFAENLKAEHLVLDNGATCIIKADNNVKLVAIQIWMGVGSAQENEYLGAGLSHLVEHMVFKGTPTRKQGEITKEIENCGGTINAYTTLDRTVFWVEMPSEHWKKGLDVLSDAVFNCSFPEDEWQREKEVILREMAMYRDNPDSVVGEQLFQTLYLVHPYRIPVIGYEDIFKKLTREDILAFHRKHYAPNNAIIVIAGDVNTKEVQKALNEIIGKLPRKNPVLSVLPEEPQQFTTRLTKKTGKYNLTRIEAGWRTVSITHPDSATLDVLARIIGHGRSSKLVDEFKEKKKLVHEITAWSYTMKDPGVFGISAILDPANEELFLKELKGFLLQLQHQHSFSTNELEKARNEAMTELIESLQTTHSHADRLAGGEFYAGSPDFAQVYLQQILAVSPEKLTEAIRLYLQENKLSLSILAPEETATATTEPAPAIIEKTIHKKKLSNGTTLLIREDHSIPIISSCVVSCGGLLWENENNNGITKLMAELLTRGTEKVSASEFAAIFEEKGAAINAFSGNNSFGLRFQCLSQHFETLFPLFIDALIHPRFDSEQVELQRNLQLAEIAQSEEQPMFHVQNNLKKMLFPAHPYRFTIEGTTNSLVNISRADLKTFHRKMVVNDNVVIAIFGDINLNDASELAEKFLKNLPQGTKPALEHEQAQTPQLPARSECKLPREQAIIAVGFPGISIKDKYSDALSLLQKIMSGLSSELLTEIRDKRGFAYYGGARDFQGLEPGSFQIYVGTKPEVVSQVEALIKEEIERLISKGVLAEEFERAREQTIINIRRISQVNGELAMQCALFELYGLGFNYFMETEARLKALSIADIKEVIKSILDYKKAAISIIVPEEIPASQAKE